ncbi:disulfide bond formation protein B [Methyloligella solikamskensis]|uniref:Disulfide bond formation protein B n=1 Tax=Methyloligella solikamskensis TaxID=1177756 RepID=A0ABW3J9M1_9HYPH
MTPANALRLNALGLLAICIVLSFAFADQILFDDLPCPLCLLQRMGFFAAGFGIALNLVLRVRTAHYGMAILGAVCGAAVSLRQIALHVVPGTGSYGDPFLGYHFYTWAFIVFCLIIAGTGVMLLFQRQFVGEPEVSELVLMDMPTRRLAQTAFLFFALLAIANGVSTVAECGAGMCADNPTDYELLDKD